MTQNKSPQLVYAGFWIRAWASLIDSVLACLILFPLLLWVYGSGYFQDYARVFELFFGAVRGRAGVEALQEISSLESLQSGPLDILISYVLPAVAVVLFWIYRSATPGKMAIRARIVDASSGLRPSNGQLVVRYVGYFISLIPAGLGFLWMAFDPCKQGWHDKIAGTVVVREVCDEEG